MCGTCFIIIPIAFDGANSLFQWKKRPFFKIKRETSLIFISGTISIIIRKNASCANKICEIYFCPYSVFARKVHFFLSCGGRGGGGGGRMPPLPLAPAGAPMATAMKTEQKYNRRKSNIFKKYQWSILGSSNLTGKFRNSHQSCSIKKGVLRNFTILTVKHLYQSLFFNKVACLHRCFPMNYAKFLRAPFLTEHLWWLLLKIGTGELEQN